MEENIHINAKGNIIDILKQIYAGFKANQQASEQFQTNTATSLSKVENSLKSVSLAAFQQNLQNVNQGLQDLNGPGLDFNSSMQDLSAITGLTGKALDSIGDKARNNAKIFGGNAAKSLESYKLLLSQLTPELAKQPNVLDAMATNVSLLSKTMGGDTIAATEVLTTAMNQYGVSMDNPKQAAKEMADMMNIMSAAAKEGSSELPTIKQAIENVGGQAKLSGLSFAEMNSAIQLLDKAGKKGAEGGTALRSILTSIGKGRFLPKQTAEELENAGVKVSVLADKNVSFTDKMRMLQPVLKKDSELINTLFGEFGQAASALIQSADAQDTMTNAIKGTQTTNEQASIVMESTAEKLQKMKASIDDAKLAFFEATGGATAYLQPITEVVTTMTSFAPILSAGKTAVMALATAEGRAAIVTKLKTAAENGSAIATKVITAAQWLWNAALTANPIGLVVAGIAVLGAAIYGAVKAFDTSTAAQRNNAAVTLEVNKRMIDERVELDLLFKQLKRTNPGTEERARLTKELKEKYPDLLAQYDLEKMKLEDIDKVQKSVITNMRNKLTAEIKLDKAKELLKEAEDMKDDYAGVFGWGNSIKWNDIREKKKEANRLINESVALENQGKSTKKNKSSLLNSPTASANPIVTPGGYSPKSTSSTSEKVMSGAGDVKRIEVRIENLVKDLNITATTIKEGAAEIKKVVTEALIGAVRDFEVAI